MTGRRGTARALAASVAAMLPLAVSGTPAFAIDAPQGPAFTPPTSPVVLVRELRRPLADGKEIVARRSYAIAFTPIEGGYRVDGTLLDVAVEAPPALAALAQLERQRADTVFPLYLDRHGWITPPPAFTRAPVGDEAVAHAASAAARQIQAARLLPAERQAGTAFMQGLAASPSALTAWPQDLFQPQAARRQETSKVALPDGSSGTVTVTLEARRAPDPAAFDSVARTVVTEFAGTRRSTVETWRMELPHRPG